MAHCALSAIPAAHGGSGAGWRPRRRQAERGAGDDAYVVDNADGVAVGNASQGSDTAWHALLAANTVFTAGRGGHSAA
jgi:hypothetical protein